MPAMEIHHSGEEWSALYVDGRLEEVGDTYVVEERAFELLGVKEVQDDAFMRGQKSREGVAPTIDEVEAYRAEREASKARAAELREQAAALLAEAEQLVGKPGKERPRAQPRTKWTRD